MTAPTGSPTGLDVDAEVRRGGFRMRLALHVPPGEVLAVLGPNGSGKTTLLRTLAGLAPVGSGRVSLDGVLLDDPAAGVFVPPEARPVGYVFQDYRLFPHLSVLDNVAFGLRGHGRTSSRREAAGWLDRLGVADLAARRPGALSGGQAQAVALARALARRPGLLLLDEPLAALDARTRLDVQAELRRHLAEFAGPCLLVTHHPLDALVLADRLVVIEAGQVVQEGPPAEVSRRPATAYVATLVGLNLYAGRARGGQVDLVDGGTFTVAEHDGDGDVLVAVRPSSVVVSTHHLDGASVRNAWPGTVTGLTLLADRVRVDVAGRPPIVADVTPAAVAELGLAAGVEVWVSVKATELEVYRSQRSEGGAAGSAASSASS